MSCANPAQIRSATNLTGSGQDQLVDRRTTSRLIVLGDGRLADPLDTDGIEDR